MTWPVDRIRILSTRLREKAAGLLFGPGCGRDAADGRRRIFFVVHNKNHMTIFQDVAPLLATVGIAVHFVTIDGHRHQAQAMAAVKAAGMEAIDLAEMGALATPRDLICLGNDWGPKRLVNWLDRLQKRGVPLAGIVEGARFGLPRLYKRVDHLLCWGRSGLEIGARHAVITGSPVIEAASRTARTTPDRPKVLVNYKFSGTQEDSGFEWGSAAIAAAQLIDPDFVVSAHPSSRGVPDHVTINHVAFSQLLANSTLVITKASTVIYEALASGVSVLYFPASGEIPAEFAKPLDAFMVADSHESLVSCAMNYAKNPIFPGIAASAFLQHHISIDPQISANERIAAALCDIMNISSELRSSQITHTSDDLPV
jgi:hypothetical protein